VITNQAGIARGYFTEADLQHMHDYLTAELAQLGVYLDAIYHCPHHPDGTIPELAIRCDCRKPQPGMLLQAASDLDLDLNASWFVGDILDDIEAGNRAGCTTILVDLGTEQIPASQLRHPTFVARNTLHALRIIRAVEKFSASIELSYRPPTWPPIPQNVRAGLAPALSSEWLKSASLELAPSLPEKLTSPSLELAPPLSEKLRSAPAGLVPAHKRLNDNPWLSVKRVLAIRLDNLGDVLVTTPALHAIKESLPSVELTLLASPMGAQVARLNPDLADVITYQAPWMDPWHKLPQDSQREQEMIATIRERHFDGAIIFTSFRQSPLPAAYLCYLADIPLRAAASIDGPGSLLTTRHKHPERVMHEVERGLDLVGALGLTTKNRALILRVPDAARAHIELILAGESLRRQRPMVVVHPGCSMPARTYPWEMYVEVIDLLVAETGATVLLTGAEDERELIERIVSNLHEESRRKIRMFAGTLPFAELCALIEAADLTITNNTGPMHISAAVNTPVVALFALTNPPEQWGPWQVPHRLLNVDVPCRICYSRVCPYQHECLRLVTPEMVVTAATDLLKEHSFCMEVVN
jgi:lipopolysaccharide heptosyltransferase II